MGMKMVCWEITDNTYYSTSARKNKQASKREPGRPRTNPE